MSPLTRYEYYCHPLLLAVAGGLNLPPLLFGVFGYITWCEHYSGWLIGNGCLAALHILASLYCVYKVRRSAKPSRLLHESPSPSVDENEGPSDTDPSYRDENPDTDEEGGQDEESASSPMARMVTATGCFSRCIHLRTPSSDRIRHLLCYDALITTYGIMFVFWIFWLSEGVQRVKLADLKQFEDEFEGCEEFHERYVTTSLVCGFAYAVFLAFAGLSSLC